MSLPLWDPAKPEKIQRERKGEQERKRGREREKESKGGEGKGERKRDEVGTCGCEHSSMCLHGLHCPFDKLIQFLLVLSSMLQMNAS